VNWADTVVIPILTSSLVAACLTVWFDYRRERRAELLAAYSEWLEWFQQTTIRARVYFNFMKASCAPIQARIDMEVAGLKRLQQSGAAPPDLLVRYEELRAEAERLGDRGTKFNNDATEAETLLGVAQNRVLMVEKSRDFRRRVVALSKGVYRELPPKFEPSMAAEAEKEYLARADPLVQKDSGLFLDAVIRAHQFRGLRLYASDDSDD